MLYTDDEILALASLEQREWVATLPTVALDDAESIALSVFRGVRSLIVRDLAEPISHETSGDTRAARRLVRGAAALRASIVDVDGDRLRPTGAGLTVVRDEAGLVSDLVRPDGTHDVVPLGAEDASWAASNLITSVIVAGLDDERRLLVRFATGDLADLLVGLGQLSTGRVVDEQEGTGFVRSASEADPAAAVGSLRPRLEEALSA